MPPKKLVLGLLGFAICGSAQLPIPIFSTGQGLSIHQTDTHWTYSLLDNSSTAVTGNAIVLSPGNSGVGLGWPASSGSAIWVSTCDNTPQSLDCLAGYPGAYTVPLNVTYSTTFSLVGLDPLTASLNINWAADDCALTVFLNGKPVGSGPGCPGFFATTNLKITSGFVAGTNTLTFVTTNGDNNYEGILVDVTGQANPIDAAQIDYAANLGAGQSIVNLTNAGTNGGNDVTDTICANVYVFAQDQQLIECCTCPLTPNHLSTLSVQNDLIANTLTPGVPTGVTTMLVATTGTCNAAAPGQLVHGLRAWGTTLHAAPHGGFAVTETHFRQVSLSASELKKMTSFCGFIQADGSKFGICNECADGAAGAARQ
ncbi:MAG TPA: hypothetical protein VG096_03010 [Bryobacteraceae bacterium]|jgi:hypothetical protein|nr:hypothetical protein [Bryobacteraceae bacterium]